MSLRALKSDSLTACFPRVSGDEPHDRTNNL